MPRINSRRKGKEGEREAAAEITRLFGCDARRTQQYCGDGGNGDVDGLPGVHLEVKRRKGINPYEAIGQAIADAPEGSLPVVLHRADSTNQHDAKPWLAIVRLDDLPALAYKLAAMLTFAAQRRATETESPCGAGMEAASPFNNESE